MTTTDPSMQTRGQIERTLSQRIQNLYKEQLDHQTGKVTCQLFADKLAIIVENSFTQPEQLLAQTGQNELVKNIREDLDEAIRPHVKDLIEAILRVQVLDIMSDATLETGRTGIIAVLDQTPTVRNPSAIPKVKVKDSRGQDEQVNP